MDEALKKELSDYLRTFISEKRAERLQQVLDERTAHIRVVLEDVYQGHNASAVLRSCDCFGIQHVHFIENRNKLKISEDVAMGSSNWLTIHRHTGKANNTKQTLAELKAMGYRIVATTPHEKSKTLDALPVGNKLALVFGTEIDGISEDVFEMADEFIKIPMYGFTESFNVSVSAALCLYELTKRARQVENYFLTAQEKSEVCFDWLRTSIDHGDALIKNYLKGKQV